MREIPIRAMRMPMIQEKAGLWNHDASVAEALVISVVWPEGKEW